MRRCTRVQVGRLYAVALLPVRQQRRVRPPHGRMHRLQYHLLRESVTAVHAQARFRSELHVRRHVLLDPLRIQPLLPVR
jgi:hypothetical protein